MTDISLGSVTFAVNFSEYRLSSYGMVFSYCCF